MPETFRPTVPDILASADVLDDVHELSDSLTAVEAVEFRQAAEVVLAKARNTIAALNEQLVKVLEGDIVRDGRRYFVRRKKDTERFDHSAIAGGVMAHLTVLAHDEMEKGHDDDYFDGFLDGGRQAIDVMSNIYLSDSTKAKVGQLDRYGIPRDPVKDPKSVRVWTPGDKAVFDAPAGMTEDMET